MSAFQVSPPANLIVRRPALSVAVTFAGFGFPPSLQVPVQATVDPERTTSRNEQESSSVVSDFGPIRTSPAIGELQPSGVSAQSPTIDRGLEPVVATYPSPPSPWQRLCRPNANRWVQRSLCPAAQSNTTVTSTVMGPSPVSRQDCAGTWRIPLPLDGMSTSVWPAAPPKAVNAPLHSISPDQIMWSGKAVVRESRLCHCASPN